jgi:flagellar hook-associated protein 3 FlgL
MPDRVNLETLINTTIMNAQLSSFRMQKLQEQISTGKKINRPSDDPDGTRKVLNLRSEDLKLDQYSSNVQASIRSIEYSESVLQNTVNLIQKVQEITVHGVNATTEQVTREVIATEIDQILESILQDANSTRLGRYIFAGTETSTTPFETTRNSKGKVTTVTYKGNREKIEYPVGPGINTQVNHTGAEVFIDTKLFDTLISIRDNLANGAIQFAAGGLDDLENAHNSILDSITKGGATISNLEITDNRIKDAKLSFADEIGEIESADIAELVLRLKEQESIFQATLASGAFMLQTSILDFI